MSPAKALRRALARTADALWDMALVTQGVSQEPLDQEGCIDWLAPGCLVLVLDGPDGAIGLASVDRQVMTALIEIQTISQVTTIPIEDRALTPTDAAMMAPLIDGALERLEENLEGHPLLPQLRGFRFGAMVEDARTAGLLLEAADYYGFRMELELGGGKRRGEMQFMLPEHAPEKPAKEEGTREGPGPNEDRLMLVPAQIEAVLCRLRLPLARVSGFKAGDLIDLPTDALARAELMAGAGHRLARGRLGQINGSRAIRLTWPSGMAPRTAASEGDDAEAPQEGSGAQGPKAMQPLPQPTAVAAPKAAQSEPAPIDLDAEAEELPDLPPLDFEGGDDDFGLSEFEFDADALSE